MSPNEILAELSTLIPHQIRNEHNFRLDYLKSRYTSLRDNPRMQYYQLEQNALWMSLYSHINWLAHFKTLEVEKVDKYIPAWLGKVFEWPPETAEAFWTCGRNPIAHTGSHEQPYRHKSHGAWRHIRLSFDNAEDWNTTGAFLALPQTTAGQPKGALPVQQTTFYYQPTEELLQKLIEDIDLFIKGLEYPDILKLQKVLMAFTFFKDDGSLARINNLLDVYQHVTKAQKNS